MKVEVKKLYDIEQIVVPQEMTVWKVADEQIEEQVQLIARLAAEETEAECAEAGDCVVCSCVSGELQDRKVQLYPGLNLPGAEEAEKEVLGLTVGSEFVTALCGEITLKIEKILRRVPAAIDDALVQAQGIEGVTTVDAYRAWYRKTAGESNREQAVKMIKGYYLSTLAEKSEFDFDRAEMDAWVDDQINQQLAMEMADLGRTEGFSEEELQEMRVRGELIACQQAVEIAVCKEHGFVFTPDMFEDQIKAMAEEMPGMEEMLDEYREMFVNNAYMDKVLELLDERAKNCLEVA